MAGSVVAGSAGFQPARGSHSCPLLATRGKSCRGKSLEDGAKPKRLKRAGWKPALPARVSGDFPSRERASSSWLFLVYCRRWHPLPADPNQPFAQRGDRVKPLSKMFPLPRPFYPTVPPFAVEYHHRRSGDRPVAGRRGRATTASLPSGAGKTAIA